MVQGALRYSFSEIVTRAFVRDLFRRYCVGGGSEKQFFAEIVGHGALRDSFSKKLRQELLRREI